MRVSRLVIVQAAAIAACCGAAVPAGAAVSITSQTITVSTPAETAVIDRSPLRMRIFDPAGKVLLSQAAAPLFGAPFVAVDPQPLGSEYVPTPSFYGPFQYEVGTEARGQWTDGPWTGNLFTGTRAGTFQSARSVIGATAEGDGVRLELATTEWTRRLIVRIAPDPASPGALRVSAAPSPSSGVIAVGDSFRSGTDEQFYGFGGQHNALSQRGRTLRTWVEAQNYGSGALDGVAKALLPGIGGSYQFPGGVNAAYYPQALFVSSRNYGFSVASDDLVRWRMAADRSDAWQVSTTGTTLDYTVAAGAPAAASSQLTQINGRHQLPPAWAQGATVSRTVQGFGGETAASYEQRVRDDLQQIETRGTPLSAYAFEGFAALPQSVVAEVVSRLRARGIRPVMYLRAFASPDGALTEDPAIFDQAVAGHYFATKPDGSPAYFTGPFGTRAGLIDFTNPAAVAWWKQRVYAVLDSGADGFMLDFGEQVLDGMRFADGTPGSKMHNRYPALMAHTTRAIVDAYEASHPGREIFFFNRAGSSGRPGSAADEESTFAGDGNTDWSQTSGLASQTTDMLNRAIGGAYGFNTDIGGYADYVTPQTTPELFTRWSQWAVFSPYFRVHNSSLHGVRQPWSFGDDTYAAWTAAATLHARALPLIRRAWQTALAGGPPPLRPLWLADPGNAVAAAEQQAWMVGDDLVAAPVVTSGARTKTLALPSGCWVYAPTGQQYTGGQRVTVDAPLTVVPYFTRCGTDPLAGA